MRNFDDDHNDDVDTEWREWIMMIMKKTEAAADLRPYIDIPTHAMPALEPGLMLDCLTSYYTRLGL